MNTKKIRADCLMPCEVDKGKHNLGIDIIFYANKDGEFPSEQRISLITRDINYVVSNNRIESLKDIQEDLAEICISAHDQQKVSILVHPPVNCSMTSSFETTRKITRPKRSYKGCNFGVVAFVSCHNPEHNFPRALSQMRDKFLVFGVSNIYIDPLSDWKQPDFLGDPRNSFSRNIENSKENVSKTNVNLVKRSSKQKASEEKSRTEPDNILRDIINENKPEANLATGELSVDACIDCDKEPLNFVLREPEVFENGKDVAKNSLDHKIADANFQKESVGNVSGITDEKKPETNLSEECTSTANTICEADSSKNELNGERTCDALQQKMTNRHPILTSYLNKKSPTSSLQKEIILPLGVKPPAQQSLCIPEATSTQEIPRMGPSLSNCVRKTAIPIYEFWSETSPQKITSTNLPSESSPRLFSQNFSDIAVSEACLNNSVSIEKRNSYSVDMFQRLVSETVGTTSSGPYRNCVRKNGIPIGQLMESLSSQTSETVSSVEHPRDFLSDDEVSDEVFEPSQNSSVDLNQCLTPKTKKSRLLVGRRGSISNALTSKYSPQGISLPTTGTSLSFDPPVYIESKKLSPRSFQKIVNVTNKCGGTNAYTWETESSAVDSVPLAAQNSNNDASESCQNILARCPNESLQSTSSLATDIPSVVCSPCFAKEKFLPPSFQRNEHVCANNPCQSNGAQAEEAHSSTADLISRVVSKYAPEIGQNIPASCQSGCLQTNESNLTAEQQVSSSDPKGAEVSLNLSDAKLSDSTGKNHTLAIKPHHGLNTDEQLIDDNESSPADTQFSNSNKLSVLIDRLKMSLHESDKVPSRVRQIANNINKNDQLSKQCKDFPRFKDASQEKRCANYIRRNAADVSTGNNNVLESPATLRCSRSKVNSSKKDKVSMQSNPPPLPWNKVHVAKKWCQNVEPSQRSGKDLEINVDFEAPAETPSDRLRPPNITFRRSILETASTPPGQLSPDGLYFTCIKFLTDENLKTTKTTMKDIEKLTHYLQSPENLLEDRRLKQEILFWISHKMSANIVEKKFVVIPSKKTYKDASILAALTEIVPELEDPITQQDIQSLCNPLKDRINDLIKHPW